MGAGGGSLEIFKAKGSSISQVAVSAKHYTGQPTVEENLFSATPASHVLWRSSDVTVFFLLVEVLRDDARVPAGCRVA